MSPSAISGSFDLMRAWPDRLLVAAADMFAAGAEKRFAEGRCVDAVDGVAYAEMARLIVRQREAFDPSI